MTTPLLLASLAASAITILLLLILLRRAGADALAARLDAFERLQERAERGMHDELLRNREASTAADRQLREEVGSALRASSDSAVGQLSAMARVQNEQLDALTARLTTLIESTERKLDGVRETVDARLQRLQVENAEKLDRMRETVDEKLQGTLDRRLGESFRLVSERLEQVHKGLGEMQSLAAGVGDLKRVLTNVKTRGTWGEVQLGMLLEQVMSPEQYAANVITRGEGSERVEFAIRLPGRHDDPDDVVWLPIDAKCPQEDYLRLLAAHDAGDAPGAEEAARALEQRVRSCARDISEKYLAPPRTTDFGIMFLPTEGLFAEVVRRPALVEGLQRDYRVVVAGPTTLAALLSSLRMGFRTLAIERRSSEVWETLGAVKTEFHRFGTVLDRVKKKLQEASNAVDKASVRTRAIERTLREVESLPGAPDDEPLLADEVGTLDLLRPPARALPADEA